MMEELLKQALAYTNHGWYVVPDHGIVNGRCTCSDSLCKTMGKHPRIERGDSNEHLRRMGSRDCTVITNWWKKWPESNVAICCGLGSSIVAIDIDPRNGGLQSLAQLERQCGTLTNTVVSQTGGSGMHLLFRHPRNTEIRNRIGLRPGIDVKGDGGRIVAPPSRHASGKVYKWINHFSNHVLAPLPNWLYEEIQFQKGTGTRKKHKDENAEKYLEKISAPSDIATRVMDTKAWNGPRPY